jgi:hypothetical protein
MNDNENMHDAGGVEEWDDVADDTGFIPEEFLDEINAADVKTQTSIPTQIKNILENCSPLEYVAIYNCTDVTQYADWGLTGYDINQVRKVINSIWHAAVFYINDVETASHNAAGGILYPVDASMAFSAQLFFTSVKLKQQPEIINNEIKQNSYFMYVPKNDLPLVANSLGAGQVQLHGTKFAAFMKACYGRTQFNNGVKHPLAGCYVSNARVSLPPLKPVRVPVVTKPEGSSGTFEQFVSVGKSLCWCEGNPVTLTECLATIMTMRNLTSIGGDVPKRLPLYWENDSHISYGCPALPNTFSNNLNVAKVQLWIGYHNKNYDNDVSYVIPLLNFDSVYSVAKMLVSTHKAELLLCSRPSILFEPRPNGNCIHEATAIMWRFAWFVYNNWRLASGGFPQFWNCSGVGGQWSGLRTDVLTRKRYMRVSSNSKDEILKKKVFEDWGVPINRDDFNKGSPQPNDSASSGFTPRPSPTYNADRFSTENPSAKRRRTDHADPKKAANGTHTISTKNESGYTLHEFSSGELEILFDLFSGLNGVDAYFQSNALIINALLKFALVSRLVTPTTNDFYKSISLTAAGISPKSDVPKALNTLRKFGWHVYDHLYFLANKQ